jgi:hypothetical protein
MVATRSGAQSDTQPLEEDDETPESNADSGSGIPIQQDSQAIPQIDNTISTEGRMGLIQSGTADTIQGRPPTPPPPPPPDITVRLQRDHEHSLYQDIMIELNLTVYEQIWSVMGIDNIRDLAAFIDQPSRMYHSILTSVLEIETQFPTTPYRLPNGDFRASISTISENVVSLKFMKDMIKVVLHSSIMGLVDDYHEYDLIQYLTYTVLMNRKSVIWKDNIERYLQHEEIQSQYLSIEADTMMDAQDETISLTSTLGPHIQPDRTMIARQHPETISIGSHRSSRNLVTPNS